MRRSAANLSTSRSHVQRELCFCGVVRFWVVYKRGNGHLCWGSGRARLGSRFRVCCVKLGRRMAAFTCFTSGCAQLHTCTAFLCSQISRSRENENVLLDRDSALSQQILALPVQRIASHRVCSIVAALPPPREGRRYMLPIRMYATRTIHVTHYVGRQDELFAPE